MLHSLWALYTYIRDLHEYIKFSHQYIQCTCSTCTQAGTDKEKGEMAMSMHVYECMNMDAAVLHLCTLYVYMYKCVTAHMMTDEA